MTCRRPPLAALGLVLLLLGAVLGAAACSSDGDDTSTPGGAESEAIDTSDGTVVDVRTPQEYDAGHLEGAVNLDVQGDDFDARLADLDQGATYYVYCQSGNRSAQAVERMRDAGFTDVTDLGGIEEAAVTAGLPIVQSSPTSA